MLKSLSKLRHSRADQGLGDRFEWAAGRVGLALLFFAGAVQKGLNPDPAQALLMDVGLPGWLVWPALLFNAGAAILLTLNRFVRPTARALAVYCVVTSVFHFFPDDPWQMSIMVKNWAIAGGCLALSVASASHSRSAF